MANPAGIRDELIPRVAVALQSQEAVAEQVRRGLAPAEQDEDEHRDQLVLGQCLVAVALEHDPSELGTVAGAMEPLDHRTHVVLERVDGRVGACQALRARAHVCGERLTPLPDRVPVGLGDADQVDDDADWQLVGELGLDVGDAVGTCAVEHGGDQVVDVPLDGVAQLRDAPRGERAHRDAPQARMLLAVVAAHEQALEVHDLEEDLVLLLRQAGDDALGQPAVPVAVVRVRVRPRHHRLDVAVASDEQRRAVVPADDAGALLPPLVHRVRPRDGVGISGEERGDLVHVRLSLTAGSSMIFITMVSDQSGSG